MMNDMMSGAGMGSMTIGMTIGWALVVAIVILAAFALIRDLRSK